jgi:raffinose/stachyose/melibiose transport system permease protein
MPSTQNAARVDGATIWELFWKIHLPGSGAKYIAWYPHIRLDMDQFLIALVLLEDPSQCSMAGALGAFQGHYVTNVPLPYTGTLIIFVISQRQIIAALLQGSVKG